MSVRYGIGDFTFPSTTQQSGLWLLEGTEYAPALAARRAVVEIPNVHYQVPLFNDPMSAVTVGMSIRVQGTNADDLATRWDFLISLFGAGLGTYVPLSRYRGTKPVEMAEAQLVSTTSPDYYCSANRIDVQAVFNIPGGAWRSNGRVIQDFPANTGDTPSTAANASNMPITDAVIRIPGPLTSAFIADGLSGTGVSWSGGTQTVPVGSFLYIYCDLMVAEITTDPFYPPPNSGGTPASGKLAFTGNGPLVLKSTKLGPMLVPYSTISVITTGGTAGPVQIAARTAVA